MQSRDVLIIGGGLTGLTAGYYLNKKLSYTILEKEEEIGGLVRTIEDEEGFKFDFTGHLLHFRKREWKEFVFGLSIKLLETERRSRIYLFDHYHLYPFQIHLSKLPKEIIYECLYGFIKAWHKREIERESNIESFYDFIIYYLGEGIGKYFMIPYNRKLWGVDLKELSFEWTARFVPRPSLEEVLLGALGIKEIKTGYNAVFYYPEDGIGELTKRLSDRVEGEILTSVCVKSVNIEKKILTASNGDSYSYKVLISTIPLVELLRLIEEELPEDIKTEAKKLRWVPLYYLDIALDKKIPFDYHWIYVPEENTPIYRVGSYTNFSDKLAPEGKSSLYVELSIRDKEKVEEYLPKIFDYLKKMGLVISEKDIIYYRIRHIPYAYVIYDKNYGNATKTIHSFLKDKNIISIGRYGYWNYSSMEDALEMGKEGAKWAMKRIKEI